MCRGIPSSSDASSTSSPPPRALLISSAIFLAILFGAFAVVAALALCCCRRRARTSSAADSARTEEPSGARAGGDLPFPVETLPTFAYARQQTDGEHGGTASCECAVCLSAVQEGEMVRQLPTCRHVYHIDCIDMWLVAHRTCPLCRSELDHPCKLNSDVLPAPPLEDPPDDHQMPV
nr:unnamed protein product [Digitaria exilis]